MLQDLCRMPRTEQKEQKDGVCHFCINNINEVDYRDTELLGRFISSYGKIMPRRRSHLCAWHQRKLAKAIKRSRVASLMPFVIK